jgi:hypothetical protein
MPKFKKNRIPNFVKICLVIALAGLILDFRPNDTSETQASESDDVVASGWNRLGQCARNTSFDGTKLLRLYEDHKAVIFDRDRWANDSGASNGERIKGSWTFDEQSNLYRIMFGDMSNSYRLLTQDDVKTCMLVKGELAAANLKESWFSIDLEILSGASNY